MCGRYTLSESYAELMDFFELVRCARVGPRYNIAPTQPVVVVREDAAGCRIGDLLQWGLVPVWAKRRSEGGKLINCRSETAATKPAFRRAFKKQRCLIPATGFFEWQETGPKTTQPWYLTLTSGEPYAFAGLWESWSDLQGTPLESCTILTTTANEFMATVHDRMPVILPRETWSIWLSPEIQEPAAVQSLLVPSPSEIWQRVPVSKLVGNVKHDSPACIQPVIREVTRTLPFLG